MVGFLDFLVTGAGVVDVREAGDLDVFTLLGRAVLTTGALVVRDLVGYRVLTVLGFPVCGALVTLFDGCDLFMLGAVDGVGAFVFSTDGAFDADGLFVIDFVGPFVIAGVGAVDTIGAFDFVNVPGEIEGLGGVVVLFGLGAIVGENVR